MSQNKCPIINIWRWKDTVLSPTDQKCSVSLTVKHGISSSTSKSTSPYFTGCNEIIMKYGRHLWSVGQKVVTPHFHRDIGGLYIITKNTNAPTFRKLSCMTQHC
jgi:hypothetical protein